MVTYQPRNVKPKMSGRLRTGVNWRGTLKQKRIKETDVKEGLGVCRSKRGWQEQIGENCMMRNLIVISLAKY
jgi:predicted anti-sigma-YlaC factor YlaD